MKIRKAKKEDSKKIAEIEHNTGYKWKQGKKEELKQANRILSSKHLQVCISEIDGKAVAYFSLTIKNKICFIEFLSVIKSEHRKGVGSTLLKKIKNIAKKNKCIKIKLSVWAKNFPAIAFYNKGGFYATQIKRNYYPNGDSKLIMEKNLK